MRDTARQLAVLALALCALCVALGVMSWLASGRTRCPFLQPDNLRAVLLQASTVVVLASGMTLVIVAGGIDLSVGSVMALGTVALALSLGRGAHWTLAVVVGAAAGAVCGLANGFCTVKGRVPAFITTLGMLLVARGLAFVLSNGQTLYEQRSASLIQAIPLAMPALTVAAGWLLLAVTRFGRGLYAVGGNAEAARLSGLRVDSLRVSTYVLCGLSGGLASAVHWARSGTGSCLVGSGFELDAIAAVVIGGTSLSGGEGHIIGTVLGALIMTVLRNGLVLMGVSEEWQKIAIGVVIVAAVYLDRLRAGRAARVV